MKKEGNVIDMNLFKEKILKHKQAFADDLITVCKENNIKLMIVISNKAMNSLILLGILPMLKKQKITVLYTNYINTYNFKKITREDGILIYDTESTNGSNFGVAIHELGDLNYRYNCELNINYSKIYCYTLLWCNEYIESKQLNQRKDEYPFIYLKNNFSSFVVSETFSEYYKLQAGLSMAFNEEVIPLDISSPHLSLTTSKVDFLNNVLKNLKYTKMIEDDYKIAFYNYPLKLLLINKDIFPVTIKELIRDVYVEISGNTVISFTPLILLNSCKYKEMEYLYNLIFKKNIKLKSKFEMARLSKYMFDSIKCYLSNYVLKYLHETLDNYGISSDVIQSEYCPIKMPDEITSSEFNFTSCIYKQLSDKLKKFHYTKNYGNPAIEKNLPSDNDLYPLLFNSLIKTPIQYIDSLPAYMYEVLNEKTSVNIYKIIKNYSAHFEPIFNFANTIVDSCLIKNCNIQVNFPVDGVVTFVKGVLRYYDAVNKNYNKFKENYFLFIDKFYNIQNIELLFDKDLVSYATFKYLKNYFNKASKINFKELVESKELFLEDEKEYLLATYIDKKMQLILKSDDFTFNN